VKAVGFTSGDLRLRLGFETEIDVSRSDRSAEVSRGHSRRSLPRRRPERLEVGSRDAHLEDAMRQPSGTVRPAMSTLKGEARRRGVAGTEAQTRMLVPKPRRPPPLREQVFAQSAEPPYTDPYVRGRGRSCETPPYPDSRSLRLVQPAASGHAAVPPSREMNSRLFIHVSEA
jgi:hypothetical protein